MNHRIALRLTTHDYANLSAICATLAAGRPDRSPWAPAASVSDCLRVALKVAAEAARNGALGASEAGRERA